MANYKACTTDLDCASLPSGAATAAAQEAGTCCMSIELRKKGTA